MIVKVSQYIAEFLATHGIKHVFTVTGGGAMHLNDSLGHHPEIKCIYNHHEQASAIAAEGYTRLSGELAGVCVTSGPGGTNALTGVVGGWLDSIPMFVISGQVKRETTIHATDIPLRQLGDQEFDIISCVRSMTKYAAFVADPNDILFHLGKAYFLCKNGRGGPVWLDIPLDVQAALVDTEKLKGFDAKEINKEENPIYNKEFSDIILKKLKEAKRPVILAGSGVRLAGAYEEFLQLVDRLQIPVVTAWNAHDLLWNEHSFCCGRPGTVGDRGGNFVVENSDFLLVLGSRLNIRQISYNYKDFAKNAFKVMVDIDKNELMKPTVKPDLPIWANVKDVFVDLLSRDLEQYFNPAHREWLQWCKNINAKYPVTLVEYYAPSRPLNPYVFITELTKGLKENDKMICGNGSACVITFQAAEIKKGQRLFTNSGCAAMGYGFPAAIGGAVAEVGKRVICIDGDGSFQMNIQELQTVVYNKLNLKIIYLNNNGYHSIRQTQTNLFHPPLVGVCDGNGLSFPDAERIAYAYQIPYMRVSSIDDIQDLLQFIEQDGPVFCEVIIDPKQNFAPKLSSKVLPDGKIVSPAIDDMYPFLLREEYEANKFIQ